MNNYLKIFSIFLSVYSVGPLHAFISYHLLVNKDSGKSVLLLGDFHKPMLDSINEKDTNDFIRNLRELSNKLASNPSAGQIPFVLELNEESARNFFSSSMTPYKMGKTFDLLMHYAYKENKPQNINFIPYEPRSEDESNTINGCLELFTMLLNEKKTNNDEDFQQFISAVKEYINDIKTKQDPVVPTVTVEQYLKSLKTGLDQLKQWQEKYSVESLEWSAINSVIIIYSSAYVQAHNYLSDQDQKISIELALLTLLGNCDDFTQGLQKCLEFEQILLLKLDYIFADVGFFHKITEQLRDQHNKVILLAGASHTGKIARLLQTAGYAVVDQKDAQIIGENLIGINKKKLAKIPERLNSSLQNFLDPSFPARLNPDYSGCNWCQKNNDIKKPLLCSRCKNAHYCDKNCQKNHWFWHKSTCKAN